MPSYYLSPIANDQQVNSAGAPLSGGKIYTYLAGTSTASATYTDNTGATPQANPIILNSLGLPASPIWLLGGFPLKFIIKDSSDALIRTIDNISGVNDTSSTASEWTSSGLTPTYISATSFSVVGDQTAIFQVNRRVRTTNTGGLIYGRITASVFASTITTVTVINDTGSIDSGLSAVAYGFLSYSPSSVPYALYAGFCNRLINGAMVIDQEFAGASTNFTAGAALKYAIDQWYGYCTGANVTGQRVAGTAPNQFNYQFTGAASVTKIGYAQRMRAANTQDLAGTTATISIDLANTLLTTVTWTAWRANTVNTFGTLAAPTRTQIGTGTFTVSSTLARYSAQIAVTSASTTGIEFEVSVGAQTSGTWTIGRAQLEPGGTATAFESTPPEIDLIRCQPFFAKTFAQGIAPAQNTGNFAGSLGGNVMGTSFTGNCFVMWRFPVVMHATPAVNLFTPGASGSGCFTDSSSFFSAGLANNPGDSGVQIYNSGGGLTPNAFAYIHATATARIP